MPAASELGAAREAVGYRLIELDSARQTVRFTRSGVELDPGGIGKGYAVDRMIAVLRRAGVQSALVNACHSSVYALGTTPENPRGWLLEIDNPAREGSGKIFLKDQSLSTSGSQEKFFEAGGHVYSHIVDPRTGHPAEGVLAVSVIASTAIESEVWSTAIFVNGLNWAFRHAPAGLAVYGCPAGGLCSWWRRDF
jgi:thiamine biosynthesis lipoprotein